MAANDAWLRTPSRTRGGLRSFFSIWNDLWSEDLLLLERWPRRLLHTLANRQGERRFIKEVPDLDRLVIREVKGEAAWETTH